MLAPERDRERPRTRSHRARPPSHQRLFSRGPHEGHILRAGSSALPATAGAPAPDAPSHGRHLGFRNHEPLESHCVGQAQRVVLARLPGSSSSPARRSTDAPTGVAAANTASVVGRLAGCNSRHATTVPYSSSCTAGGNSRRRRTQILRHESASGWSNAAVAWGLFSAPSPSRATTRGTRM
jgi:hypothetical protein